MHEMAWAAHVVRQATAIAREQGAGRVVGVTVRFGPHAGLSLERVRAHFAIASRGTIAEGAQLRVREPGPGQSIDHEPELESIEVES